MHNLIVFYIVVFCLNLSELGQCNKKLSLNVMFCTSMHMNYSWKIGEEFIVYTISLKEAQEDSAVK